MFVTCSWLSLQGYKVTQYTVCVHCMGEASGYPQFNALRPRGGSKIAGFRGRRFQEA